MATGRTAMRLMRDTWLLFAYHAQRTLRNPVWVVFGLFQPVLWLLLFAPLLDGLAGAPGLPPDGVLAAFTPGVLVMLALFGSAYVGFGLVADLRAGVLERLAVTPASRLALVLGPVLRDAVALVVQASFLLLTAWALGLRADPVGVVAALGLVLLIGLLTASCSYAIALAVRDENGLSATLNFAMMPLLLLSGIILPLTLAPGWLRGLAAANPFSHVVDAARALFVGALADPTVARGFAVTAVLAVLALAWAARSFRQVAA